MSEWSAAGAIRARRAGDRPTQNERKDMVASCLIIAAVLALVGGHLTLVHRMFMCSETRGLSAPVRDETKMDLRQIAAPA